MSVVKKFVVNVKKITLAQQAFDRTAKKLYCSHFIAKTGFVVKEFVYIFVILC